MGRLVHFACRAPLNKTIAVIGDGATLGRWSIKRPLILEADGDYYKGSIEIDDTPGQVHYRYVQGAQYTHDGRQVFSVLHYEDEWSDNKIGARAARSFTIDDNSPMELTQTDAYRAQGRNNGFMHQHECQLVLHMHRAQKSPLTLYEHKPTSFSVKLDTKAGPIENSVRLAKLGDYNLIDGLGCDQGVELDEKDAFSLTYTARFATLENLLLDVDIRAKSQHVNGRLDPSKFCEKSGTIKIDLYSCDNSSDSVVGNLKLDYLVVHPVRLHAEDPIDVMWPRLDQRQYVDLFETKRQLHMGHRGCGNSYYNKNAKDQYDENLNSSIRENCVNSFQMAHKVGKADMVEFDVQLTRDMTPVVYHDFGLLYKGQASTVNKHTLSQLQQIDDVEHSSRATMTHPLNFKRTDNPKDAPYPTLLDVLFDVTDKLGYNIEVKWPGPDIEGNVPNGLDSFFEINRYCDEIINVANRNAGKRSMYYSSFNADVCICLSLKQSTYPVYQLVNGDTGYYKDRMDTRVRRISRAATHCQLWRMTGLVSLVDEFLKNQDTAKKIAAYGLRSACYGHLLCVDGMRKLLNEQPVNGIIYDNIHVYNK